MEWNNELNVLSLKEDGIGILNKWNEFTSDVRIY